MIDKEKQDGVLTKLNTLTKLFLGLIKKSVYSEIQNMQQQTVWQIITHLEVSRLYYRKAVHVAISWLVSAHLWKKNHDGSDLGSAQLLFILFNFPYKITWILIFIIKQEEWTHYFSTIVNTWKYQRSSSTFNTWNQVNSLTCLQLNGSINDELHFILR